jgi:hypothetical protein
MELSGTIKDYIGYDRYYTILMPPVVCLVIGAVLAEGEAACLLKRLVERLLQEHVVLAVHFLLSPRKVLVVVVLACC